MIKYQVVIVEVKSDGYPQLLCQPGKLRRCCCLRGTLENCAKGKPVEDLEQPTLRFSRVSDANAKPPEKTWLLCLTKLANCQIRLSPEAFSAPFTASYPHRPLVSRASSPLVINREDACTWKTHSVGFWPDVLLPTNPQGIAVVRVQCLGVS